MGLSVGIVGLPNVGKSTLFNALTKRQQAAAENYPFCTIEPNSAIVEVADSRLDELAKINRVLARELPEAKRETLLVLDATTGQNALVQAKEFRKAAEITGLVLTKLDGTAKGGIVLAIRKELGIPVRYIGVGEGIDDLRPFDGKAFVNAFFDTEE